MKQSSKRTLSLLASGLFALLAVIVYFDFVKPEYPNFATLKGQVASEQDFLTAETKGIAQAKNIISEYGDQNVIQQTVNLAMPSNQDIAGALAQVYGISQNNGVAIQSINIAPPSIQANSSQGSIIKPIGTYQIQINGVASYENLKNFISGIETNVRVFDIKNLALQPAPGNSRDLFSFNLTIATYFQTP